MSLLDKVQIIKNFLQIVDKVVAVILNAMDFILKSEVK